MCYLRARREFEERSLPPEIEYPTHIIVDETEDLESVPSPLLSDDEEGIEVVESPLQEFRRALNAAILTELFVELQERILTALNGEES